MDIREDKKNSLVIIDGTPISGFIDEGACPKCMCDRIYSHDYDAYFCINCNEWIESQCGDSSCEYCKKRPEKPLMLINK